MASLKDTKTSNSAPTCSFRLQKQTQNPRQRDYQSISLVASAEFPDLGTMLSRYVRGDYVEIISNEEGFFGSYYTATVLRPEGNNHYLVEYETLLADDEKGMLRDVVHAGEMRPFPPEIRATEFLVGDLIDAFDNDGWWVGAIEGRDRSGCYWVRFDTTGDRICYCVNRIRVHQELDEHGRWSIPKFHKSMKI